MTMSQSKDERCGFCWRPDLSVSPSWGTVQMPSVFSSLVGLPLLQRPGVLDSHHLACVPQGCGSMTQLEPKGLEGISVKTFLPSHERL